MVPLVMLHGALHQGKYLLHQGMHGFWTQTSRKGCGVR
jgi:hypothetical protein